MDTLVVILAAIAATASCGSLGMLLHLARRPVVTARDIAGELAPVLAPLMLTEPEYVRPKYVRPEYVRPEDVRIEAPDDVSIAPAAPLPVRSVPSIDVSAVRSPALVISHLVLRHVNGERIVEFPTAQDDPYDAHGAREAWRRIESDPDTYPGEHEFLENGRRRGHKPHKAAE